MFCWTPGKLQTTRDPFPLHPPAPSGDRRAPADARDNRDATEYSQASCLERLSRNCSSNRLYSLLANSGDNKKAGLTTVDRTLMERRGIVPQQIQMKKIMFNLKTSVWTSASNCLYIAAYRRPWRAHTKLFHFTAFQIHCMVFSSFNPFLEW